MINKKKQGKRNKQAGARFELKVRKDLESKGWIVSKWMNNVEWQEHRMIGYTQTITFEMNKKPSKKYEVPKGVIMTEEGPKAGKLIPAKHKFRGIGIPMAIGTGFPDFIAFVNYSNVEENELTYPMVLRAKATVDEKEVISFSEKNVEIIGVEVKSNGYLDKKEKEKCKWLLDNNIFSKILIAKKGKRRGEIIYEEWKAI